MIARTSLMVAVLSVSLACFGAGCGSGESDGGGGGGETGADSGSGFGGFGGFRGLDTEETGGGDTGTGETGASTGGETGGDTGDTGETGGDDVGGQVPCNVDADCPSSTPICQPPKCVECTLDMHCPAARPFCSVTTNVCLECQSDDDCDPGATCDNGNCEDGNCEPGETVCSGSLLKTCNGTGLGWDLNPCESGACEDGECKFCDPECPEGQVCWQGECKLCKPGEKRCQGSVVQACNGTGDWENIQNCADTSLNCYEPGYCANPCTSDPKFQSSNTGCDYWAVDLDNHVDANHSPFAIIVSNLNDFETNIEISVQHGSGHEPQIVAERVVPPQTLEVFDLPQYEPGGAKVSWNAYRIKSDDPIVAYQFNPLDNVDVFSNDASLLIPSNTYGKEYIVTSRAELLGGGPAIGLFDDCNTVCSQYDGGYCVDAQTCVLPYRGTVTVVAPAADTVVTVRPSVKTLAGDGVPAMNPNQDYEFTLQPYQVLNIKSDQNAGDLTGTIVTADKAVAVFGGHEAAVSSTTCCADHLEQQMFPVDTWGSTYVATKAFARGIENDYWRIVSAQDGTVVSFEPEIESPKLLDRGKWVEIASTADFVITANNPVSVSQVLASSQEVVSIPAGTPCNTDSECGPSYTCEQISLLATGCLPPSCTTEGSSQGCPGGHTCACFDTGLGTSCSCSTIGDPALILMAPQSQFRNEYVFLTPNKYKDDYINVIAPTDASVDLDGAGIPAGNFEPVAQSGFKVARLKVQDGVHAITSDKAVGIVAYGYDRDVSYGYTAGLNLTKTGE